VGCKALVTADRFKTSNYVGMLRELAPEIDPSAPGRLRAARLPALTTLIRIGAGEAPGLLLGARGPQSCQPMPVHRVLPGKEFVHCEQVAGACFVKREQAAAYGRDDLGLATYHPPRRAGRR
jgi:hypothetical protein